MTEEERAELASAAAENPWELTLELFLARLRNYGYETRSLAVFNPKSGSSKRLILVDGTGKRIPLPTLLPGDQLTLDVTASLCRQFGIPLEDFGLMPDEDG